jgi:hypothetical protein
MKRIRYILIIAILCLAYALPKAQETKKLEFGINGFYGLSGLTGTVTNGSISPGLGYQLSINGKYFFLNSIGVGIGAGYATYMSTANLNSYASNTPAKDDEGESFEYKVTASGIKEELHLSAIEIPVYLVYREPLSEKLELKGNIGVKVLLPLSATYKCTEGAIETTGYYPSNNVVYANMPNHGFETITKMSYSGDLSTVKAYYSLFADVGVSFPMGKLGINLSLYGSYGLNSVLEPKSNLLIDYPGNYNSLSSLSGKVCLISGGLRIGVGF